MKESKIKTTFLKFIREISLWSFRNLKLFHEIRQRRFSIPDNKKPVFIRVCDCDKCRARKIRRQFSMTQEEGFEVLAVSNTYFFLV